MALDFQSVAQIVAGRGLNTLLEGLALAALSSCVLRVFGGRSSMIRFAVWFSTLLVIAGLPLLTHAGSSLAVSGVNAPGLTLSAAWATGLFVAWAVIAGGLLIRLGFSLGHLYRLRRECCEVDGGSHPALTEVVQEFSAAHPARTRRVKLLVSEEVRVPTALGFFRPAVVLPTWALRDLSADELKGIVLHELAHLRRWDDWTNLAQKFVKALFFFHPAVWWIDSRLALEREIACDDMALEQTANARTYAASLVSVAEKVVSEKVRRQRALALAQSALGRVREVSLRVKEILATDRPRTTRGWRPALAMIGALSVITVGAMPYAPELISFQGRTQSVGTASSSVASIPRNVTPLGGAGERTSHYIGSGKAFSALLRMDARHAMIRQSTGEAPLVSLSASARRSTVTGGAGTKKNLSQLARREPRPTVIPAKATLHKKDRTPKLVLAKASDDTRPAEMMLVLHAAQFDESQSTVWTLTVWRLRTAGGEQQILQQTVVMNSL